MKTRLSNRRILLIISGGIAAYKSLDLIRRLREAGASVRCILTEGGAQFVTPLSISALSEEPVYRDLWSLTDEQQMGHIRLSREADLVVVAPASADLIAKMAHGFANDLASTVLLATNKPVLIAPAMNVQMWKNPATQANLATISARGCLLVGPSYGIMACGEEGEGRMAEPEDIRAAISSFFAKPGPLAGKRALVTSGPTYEPLDPVRFIGNRSSGKQGLAIAEALYQKGAETILVTGPTHLPDPSGIETIHVQTALEMLTACEAALPIDIAVCTAAVSDWRPSHVASEKLKKGTNQPRLELIENPDILATLAQAGPRRPRLVVGFAAETENMLANATQKLTQKVCDWIVANEVGVNIGFEKDENEVTLLRKDSKGKIVATAWPRQTKTTIGHHLADEIAAVFKVL